MARDPEHQHWFDAALCHSRVDFLPLLLERGFDPNARVPDGNTALMGLAALRRRHHLARAAALMAAGADPNALNERGESALSYAANCNFGSMVQLLLTAGADVRAGHGEYVAPATARCWSGPRVQALLEASLDEAELARLPKPWASRWHFDSVEDVEDVEVDVQEADGRWSWIRSPYPDFVWVGDWPPPGPPDREPEMVVR